MKLQLINKINALLLFFFSITISINAQNATQTAINNTSNGNNVTIDSYSWRVATKKDVNGERYALLFSAASFHTNTAFGSNNVYNTSYVRAKFNDLFANSNFFNNLRQIAVIPYLANSQGLSSTARSELPANPQLSSVSGVTEDVVFLPSMQDIRDYRSHFQGTVGPSQRLITRNPFDAITTGHLCTFLGTSLVEDGGIWANNDNRNDDLKFRAGIWVRISALPSLSPTVSSINEPAKLCSGDYLTLPTPAIINNGYTITSQSWQIESSAGNFTNIMLPYQVSDSDNGKKLRYRISYSGGFVYSNEVNVAVNPKPVLAQLNNLTYNEGNNVPQISFSGTNVNSVTWEVTSGSGTIIGMYANYGTGNIPGFVATNSTSSPIEISITVVPKSPAGCEGDAKTFTITVNPQIEPPIEEIMVCEGVSITLTAIPTNGGDSPTYQWIKNGAEIPGATGETYTYTPENGDIITCEMTSSDDCAYPNKVTSLKVKILVTEPGTPVVWTPEKNLGASDAEKQDWNIEANWTPNLIPTACHNVFIPGDSKHYPNLTSEVACNNIYFMHGGELGRPDLLTYNQAYVQLNLGLKQFVQEAIDYPDLLKSNDTFNRMWYSAARSADPLERERWYMLSSPLKNVVTGDLGFGGFPLTFLMKFGPNKSNPNYPVGEWTTPYNSMTEPVASSATDGFAYFMYGFGMSNNDIGSEESGSFNDLNDTSYMPYRTNLKYGIREINGILELPFFADSTNLYAHRTQVYNPASGESTFYYIDNGMGTNGMEDFNKLTGNSEYVIRDSDNYRFVAEDANGKFQTKIYHSGAGLGGNVDFLVGNPYMSSIDMIALLKDNESTIQQSYKIWNGTTFNSYNLSGNHIVDNTDPANPINNYPSHLAPMQGFFLTTTDDYNGVGDVAVFDVKKLSITRPIGTDYNLRNSKIEENILRIKAENNSSASSHLIIGYRENASNGFIENEDTRKLFSPYRYVPEVYALAGEIPVDINFINTGREIIVPLGIKTDLTGEIRLTFTGMNNYFKATKIELIDARENRTIDLTGKQSFTYTFSHSETGISNGRFSLRISNSTTDLPDITVSDDLKVYGNSKGIYVISSSTDPVQQVTVYDFQGRKVYESASNAGYYPLQGSPGNSPLIVKVITKNGMKTVKLNGIND